MDKFLIAGLVFSSLLVAACAPAKENRIDKQASVGKETHTATKKADSSQDKVKDNETLTEEKQQKEIELFDGRNSEIKTAKPDASEIALITEEVKLKANEDFLQKRLGELGKNVDWDQEFDVSDIAEGAFTKPDTKQKAYLYRYSYTNGIVITENSKIVAHYSGDPGDLAFYVAIKAAPDINKNGLSEIILFRNVEDNEDIIPYLFESNGSIMKFHGEGNYFDSGYVAGDDTDPEKATQNAYRITVEPSKNPTFFQETYERTGSKGIWKLMKKSEKFSWDKSRGDEGVYDLTKI